KETEPEEVLLLRDQMAVPGGKELVKELWTEVSGRDSKDARRFRALVALARLDAKNPRWPELGKTLVGPLLAEDPLHVAVWSVGLRDVKEHLLVPLTVASRDRDRPAEQRLATSVLADHAAKQPDVLADLLLDADPKQYAILFPVLQGYREQAIKQMQRELAVRPAENDLPSSKREEREQLARRQPTAAVTLLKLDAPELAWPLYRHRADPEARSQLLWRGGLLGLDPKKLVQRLEVEQDVSAQRALILALGEFSG